jgi:chromosome segregation ATPase
VEDLRERMKLLQGDRRANIEIVQANKDSNKDEISRLRGDNKELRVKIGSIQRAGSTGGEATEGDLQGMRVDAMRLRKHYDTLRLECASNKKELQELKDEVQSLDLEARRPNQEDSPLTRNIRMLENRLDKAMIKYNEAQSIRKTYEQIVKRLQDERIGFDSQLGALERTLGAKQRDYEELILLSGDANHARDVAKVRKELTHHLHLVGVR